MMAWFMELPEPVQKAISIFIMLAAVLGLFLMLFGQIGLGVTSMVKAFPFLIGAGGKVIAIFQGIAAAIGVTVGTLAAIIAAVIAVAIGIFVAFKENFMKIKLAAQLMINGFKRMFKGLIDFIAMPFRIIAALIKGDFKGVWTAIKKGFKGAFDVVTGLLQGLYFAVTIVAVGLFRVFKAIVDFIVKIFNWLKDKLVGHSIIPDIVNAIIDWFWKIPNMLKNIVKTIANVFIGLGNAIISMWNLVLGGIGKIMVKILRMADKAIAVVNKIPGVNIPRYSWSINWGNVPSIPYLASGGIVKKPTLAMLGEKGEEAVVPLNKGRGGFSGFGQNIIVNATYNINVSDKVEMEKLIRENNINLVEEIKRKVAV